MFESFGNIEIILLVFAGIITGIINTVAGSGTIVSLGALVWIGLPITLANTTNRVGVFFQNSTALVTLRFFNSWPSKSLRWVHLTATLIGALLGGIAAANISQQSLEIIASIVLILLMLTMIFDIRKFMETRNISIKEFPVILHVLSDIKNHR
jgi:hypothetical protein